MTQTEMACKACYVGASISVRGKGGFICTRIDGQLVWYREMLGSECMSAPMSDVRISSEWSYHVDILKRNELLYCREGETLYYKLNNKSK